MDVPDVAVNNLFSKITSLLKRNSISLICEQENRTRLVLSFHKEQFPSLWTVMMIVAPAGIKPGYNR